MSSNSTAQVVIPTDSELLMQFVEERDEAAFRTLVERHGQLVVQVCQRVLHRQADVEDAVQATFLVLARQAGSVRCQDSLVGWLFRVAHRTAARAARQRSRLREIPLEEEPEQTDDALAQLAQRESFESLGRELNRLPEKYRMPLLLFYLEGRSRREAALQLDCSTAAFKGRLARGRKLLRKRLMRRGIALSTVVACWQAVSKSASAATAAGLEQTVRACVHHAATGQPGGLASHVISLAQGIKPMSYGTSRQLLCFGGSALACGAMLLLGLALPGSSTPSNSAPGERWSSPVLAQAAAAEPSPATTRLVAADSDEPQEQPAPAGTDPFGPTRSNDPFGARPAAAPRPNQPQKQPPSVQPDRTSPSGSGFDAYPHSPQEQAIEEALERDTQLNFLDQPLSDLANYISTLYKIEVVIDAAALKKAGMGTDAPISVSLKGISLESALKLALEQLELTYILEDDVLKFTTMAAESQLQKTRIYPLRQFVDNGFDPDDVQQVVMMIDVKATIAATLVNDFLVVSATPSEHRRIRRLLESLHQAASSQP